MLLTTFPDATIVVTHRDPVAVVQSTATMMAYSSRMSYRHTMPEWYVEYWTDRMARIQHLFSAGPVATLSVRLDDGKFIDVELSRKQLDDLGLSEGDKVAIRSHPPA